MYKTLENKTTTKIRKSQLSMMKWGYSYKTHQHWGSRTLIFNTEWRKLHVARNASWRTTRRAWGIQKKTRPNFTEGNQWTPGKKHKLWHFFSWVSFKPVQNESCFNDWPDWNWIYKYYAGIWFKTGWLESSSISPHFCCGGNVRLEV